MIETRDTAVLTLRGREYLVVVKLEQVDEKLDALQAFVVSTATGQKMMEVYEDIDVTKASEG